MSDMRPNKAEVEFYRKVNQQLVQKDKLIRSLQKKLDDLQARVSPPATVDAEGHEVELELQQLEHQLMQLSIEDATQPPPKAPHEETVLGAVEAAIAPVETEDWDAFLAQTPAPEEHAEAEEPQEVAAPQLSIVVPRVAEPVVEAPEPAPAAPPEATDAEAGAYAAALTQRARRKLEHLRSMAEADSDAEVLTAALRLYEWYLWRSRQGYRLQLVGEDGVREVDLLL
jgi:hypothetical protein